LARLREAGGKRILTNQLDKKKKDEKRAGESGKG
jgi:hypothetical protein